MKVDMEAYGTYPAEVQKKMAEMLMAPTFATEKVELNAKFFTEADKNNDGMLDKEEHMAYLALWEAYLMKHCGEYKVNAEHNAASFDVYRISGKDGITMEDLKQVMAWEDELMASMQ